MRIKGVKGIAIIKVIPFVFLSEASTSQAQTIYLGLLVFYSVFVSHRCEILNV